MFEYVNKINLFNAYKELGVKLSLKDDSTQSNGDNSVNDSVNDSVDEFWRLESIIDRTTLLGNDDWLDFDRGFNEDGFVEE